MLSFESSRYLTHQKTKNILVPLYSWDFEAKNDDPTEVQNKEAIEIIIEENEDREVVKPKKKRKSPQIHDSDDEDVEEDYSEVIRSKVKRAVGWLLKSGICFFFFLSFFFSFFLLFLW